MSHTWYHWEGDDLFLSLHLQPGAAHDALAGTHGERLKVRIAAVPVDGKANDHLIRYLSRLFGVPRRQVSLLGGHAGRSKRIRIRGPRRLPEGIARSAR